MVDTCEKDGCPIGSPLPNEDLTIELAELFKMFSDSTRVRILYALMGEELCVLHLSEHVGASQSAVSHQLRILKQAHLVKSRREGKLALYSLTDEHVERILEMGMEHIQE